MNYSNLHSLSHSTPGPIAELTANLWPVSVYATLGFFVLRSVLFS